MLTIYEKGYGLDEIEYKTVDVSKGENFSPQYLRINSHGTVPTLVVPLEKTLSVDMQSKFKALTDTKVIVQFLDRGRSMVAKTHTTSSAPAPVLAPATVEGNSVSKSIISLLYQPSNALPDEAQPTVDPNFLVIACQTEAVLAAKASSFPGQYIKNRAAALKTYVEEVQSGSFEVVGGRTEKVLSFLKTQEDANKALLDIFSSPSTPSDQRSAFIALSAKAYAEQIPHILSQLDAEIIGPYSLGDHLSLADLYVTSWLSRLISSVGGTISDADGGLQNVEEEVNKARAGSSEGTFMIGVKVKGLWKEITARDSFKKVYKDGLY